MGPVTVSFQQDSDKSSFPDVVYVERFNCQMDPTCISYSHMKIIVNYLNGNSYWQDKVRFSSATATQVITSPDFLDLIRSQTMFDFTADSPAQIAAKIEDLGDIQINVGFYSKFFSFAIAYEEDGGVYFNTRKESKGAGSPGNVAHELMHAIGYQHNGNSPNGNQNTVPWWIGNQVDLWIKQGKYRTSSSEQASQPAP